MVTIVCSTSAVQERHLTVASSNQTKLEWVYEVSTTVSHTLLNHVTVTCNYHRHTPTGPTPAGISGTV